MPISGPPLEGPVVLHEILKTGLESKPDDDALVSRRQRWSWRRLDDVSTRLAASYLELGLVPGDRVASLMPNRTELLVHYIACMKSGLVAMPLNYRYMAPEIDHALSVGEPRILLAHDERRDDLAASKLAGKLPLGQISYDDDGGHSDVGAPSFKSLAEVSPVRDIAPPKSDDPAIIFFTSGSTGEPKGVTHTAQSLGWMFAIAASAFELSTDDVLLPGSSCSHIGGFIFAFAALGAAARLVIARHYDGDEILALLRRERPTVLCMIPAALFAVVRDPGAVAEDFASLRLVRAGADKVPAELEAEFTALTGHVIDEGYGMSEVGLAALNPPSGRIVAGSVGRALAAVEFSLRDDAGNELPADATGNLWIRTPSMMQGYWSSGVATAEVIREGWLDSGDRMAADGDGYLWFRGRKKQIIVHDGSNIFPQEVEEAVEAHPAVALSGVIGIHDLVHGESVRAYVALKPGVPRPTTGELIAAARALIGYKAPEQIEFLDEIPLNPTGKVDRVALKKMAEARHEPA